MKDLFEKVRIDRKEDSESLSAQDGIDIPSILQKIIDNQTFLTDWEKWTKTILYENVSYQQAIVGISKIIESGVCK